MNQLVLDIASAPIPDAADYLEEPPPNKSIKDEEKQAAWIANKKAGLLAEAALDLDLARITAVGWWDTENIQHCYHLCRDEHREAATLRRLADLLAPANTILITFNGLRFDLPLLQRRALYLSVPFPRLDLDRYRSPHKDLCQILSGRDPQRVRSLNFYVKRLGWTDLEKPLSGEEEAQVFTSGKWDELAASVRRDVEAVRRLAVWMGELDEDPIIP